MTKNVINMDLVDIPSLNLLCLATDPPAKQGFQDTGGLPEEMQETERFRYTLTRKISELDRFCGAFTDWSILFVRATT